MTAGMSRLRLSKVELKCFKAAFLPPPVPLGMFNLLVGRNGSGKSTLIEALQWIDTGVRQGIREACDPFNGIANLLNKRIDRTERFFDITLSYAPEDPVATYRVRVRDLDGLPELDIEQMQTRGPLGISGPAKADKLLQARESLSLNSPSSTLNGESALSPSPSDPSLRNSASMLSQFWRDAVFLRMLPSALSTGARLDRKSWEPILDESGRLLPALLAEVMHDPDRKAELLRQLRDILPWTRDLDVPTPASRDIAASYVLHEQLGVSVAGPVVPIPAWMLSEGTRRLTAILALLNRDPAPSLLCIEEIENGLDPWTVRAVLRELQAAADRGVQVIATTHSPWVLDDVSLDNILQVRRVDGDIIYQRFADRPEVQAYHPSVPAGTRYVNEAE